MSVIVFRLLVSSFALVLHVAPSGGGAKHEAGLTYSSLSFSWAVIALFGMLGVRWCTREQDRTPIEVRLATQDAAQVWVGEFGPFHIHRSPRHGGGGTAFGFDDQAFLAAIELVE